MKKKIIAMILSGVIAVTSLAGCSLGKRNEMSGPINQKTESDEPEPAPAPTEPLPELPVQLPDSEPDTEPAPLPEPEVSDDRYLLYDGSGDAPYYIVDENGTKTAEITKEEIVRSLGIEGEENLYLSEVGMLDGIFYVTVNGNDSYRVAAYDPERHEGKFIWDSKGLYLCTVDLYNDHIYVVTDKYDSSYDNVRFYETELTRKGDSLDYEEADSPSAGIISKVSDYNIQLPFLYRSSYSNQKCITRIFDEGLFVLAIKDDEVYMIKSDGDINKLKLQTNGNYVTVDAYDANYAYLSWYDDETGSYIHYCYDLSADRYEEIGVVEPLLCCNGYFYYCVDESDTYGVFDTHVYAYDPDGGRRMEQYEYVSIPGARQYRGTTGFSVINSQIYIVGVEKRESMWLRVNYDESGASYTDIYCPLSKIGIFDYGTIDYSSGIVKCPKCDNPVYKFYFETFSVDSGICLGYKKINEALSKNTLDTVLIKKEHYEDPENQTDCEDHEYEQYCETEDITIDSVSVLNNKYLTVDTYYYWYAGGAHGMPGIDQYVFDMDTGDQVYAADMFAGTEEDFKVMVANAVVEDYNNNPDRYYIEKGEVYDTAYEYAGFNSTTIKFMEDGVHVYFAPYSLGPYAMGFIDVVLSYKDFLGRDQL